MKSSALPYLLFSILVFLTTPGFSQSQSWHSLADEILRLNVSGGNVNYEAIKKRRKDMDQIILGIKNAKPTEEQKKAFYINAYNLLVINEVIKSYPLTSVMNIPEFFDKKIHTVAGSKMSLNELEKTYLMGIDRDPRLHFVLVCAAVSCPQLAPFAYVSGKLDGVLNTRTRMAVDNPDFVTVNPAAKTVTVSKIFEWYADDFGGKDKIISWINLHRTQPIPHGYTLAFHPYDWTLNKTP